jgi:hypothetical protein
MSGSGEFIHRLLAGGQEIGDTEFDNDAQRLRRLIPLTQVTLHVVS